MATEVLAELEPMQRLSRDLRNSAKLLTPAQARYLVDLYYQIQEYRKRAANQKRAFNESGEPPELIGWVFSSMEVMEGDIRRALDRYSDGQAPGQWAKSIVGIGPVLSAGLLAHIDITRAPTAGHIWRFAGLDSTNEWLGKERAAKLVKETLDGAKVITTEHRARIALATNRRAENVRAWDGKRKALIADVELMTPDSLAAGMARRPWNAKLKVLCWLAGESFVKVSNNPKDVYGHIYAERKEQEQARNDAGEYAAQAAAVLAAKKIGKDTDAYGAYSVGKLPPAHIHARAKRYAVKIFLAHLHHVMYEDRYGKPPPFPYVLTHMGHAHYTQPPNWPM